MTLTTVVEAATADPSADILAIARTQVLEEGRGLD